MIIAIYIYMDISNPNPLKSKKFLKPLPMASLLHNISLEREVPL